MNQTTPQQIEFLQSQILDGGFLQSQAWMDFQKLTGKRAFHFEAAGCFANVIEHTLPIVGKYWYIPRGPVVVQDDDTTQAIRSFFTEMITQAKREKIAFVRIEPANENVMRLWSEVSGVTIQKASHDVQPKEILVMAIDKDAEILLSEMKSKTRYNIRLAQKKGVQVIVSRDKKYVDAFCDLVEVTAKRDGIVSHPRNHYQKMLQAIPEDMLKLYVAEYNGEIIAANLVLFFGKYATYMHGASSNDHREVMAPYLLQWQQIQDAHKLGCDKYDFGGVSTDEKIKWSGITRFKQGFAPQEKTMHFLGTYDTIVLVQRYFSYIFLQKLTLLIRKMKRIVS